MVQTHGQTRSDRLFAQLINRPMRVLEVIRVVVLHLAHARRRFRACEHRVCKDRKINWPSLSSLKTKVWPLSCLIKTKLCVFQEVLRPSADALLQVSGVMVDGKCLLMLTLT